MRIRSTRLHLAMAVVTALVLCVVSLAGCLRVGVTDEERHLDVYAYDEVSAIELDLSACEVICHTGEQVSVSVERMNYPEVRVDESGGVVCITEVRDSLGRTGVSECRVDITVPEGLELDGLSLEVDAASVQVSDVSARTIDIDVDAGEVILRGVAADTAVLDVDAGSITLSGFADIDRADVLLEVEWGEVEFLGLSEGSSYSQTGSGPSVTANVEAGSITVEE